MCIRDSSNVATHRALRSLLAAPGFVRSAKHARRLGRRGAPRIVRLGPVSVSRAFLTFASGGG
eukprot:1782101-Alexandrium_andersonii.AAC.1